MTQPEPLLLGIDVGSTTVKLALLASDGVRIEQCAYQRHHGALRAAVERGLATLDADDRSVWVAVTGSGAPGIAASFGAPRIHEVTALAAAVHARHPAVASVIEIGGQDGKLLRLARDGAGAEASMNDRCAAGTGVTLDRCLRRLGVESEEAALVRYEPSRVRPLSSKCGVFAETDAVNLARAGVPSEPIVISLADAIVVGTLTLLARGEEVRPDVLLLGGPITFLPVLHGAFRHHFERRWREAAMPFGPGSVAVTDQGLFYPALGAALSRARDHVNGPRTIGSLRRTLMTADRATPTVRCDAPLARDERDVAAFDSWVRSNTPPWPMAATACGGVAVGLDAGSTVFKAVAVNARGVPVARAARSSRDPIADARAVLDEVRTQLRRTRAGRIQHVGVTGYGASVLAPVLGADVEVLETVANAHAARALVPEVDVVCDVGGQDIKVLSLARDGAVQDFRISSQCSAGIGMVLESTARELGVSLDAFAQAAFSARRAPWFGESCVVFLDSSRIGLQRLGFSREEILAGLARAVARVVWNHVVHDGALTRPGCTIVLQGGVQHNRAALMAERDWIVTRIPDARVVVHPLPSEAGALGAALLAQRSEPRSGDRSRSWSKVPLSVVCDESTRCRLCTNHCARTAITYSARSSGEHVLLAGNACAAGATLDPDASTARSLPLERKRSVPNLLAEEARRLFARPNRLEPVRERSRRVRIGIPRTLSMYRSAPFFRAYLQSLGVRPTDVVFSPPTHDAMVRDAAFGGATDPCFPAKVMLAHVRHLLRAHDRGDPLDALFVPRSLRAATPVRHALDCASCPVVAASPALVRASFALADDALGRRGIALIDDTIDLCDPERLREQMHAAFGALLEVSRSESDQAVTRGAAAMTALDESLQASGADIFDALERNRTRGAVLIIARPYHADPGVSHHVGDELQSLGYPVLTIRSLPREPERLDRWLRHDLASGRIEDPFDIRDLLPDGDNSGSIERVWAARIAAAHGRLGVVDVSSFKCAQDAGTYAPMRTLFETSGTVCCRLHDLDETRPATSLRIRLRTFVHALEQKGLHPWSHSSVA